MKATLPNIKDLFVKWNRKVGQSPGTPVYTGPERVEPVTIQLMDYSRSVLTEETIVQPEDLERCKAEGTTSWINVYGLHDVALIESIGKVFDIHPLVLEDIVSLQQRPKADCYDDYLYIVLKMIWADKQTEAVQIEQVSLILGEHYVITFQERQGDIFDQLRKRIRGEKSRMRHNGADYLAYRMLDLIVDHYLLVLDFINNRIESLEDTILENPDADILQDIHPIRRELAQLRRLTSPSREIIHVLETEAVETELITENTLVFLKDVKDHTLRAADMLEHLQELTGNIVDLHITTTNTKMNEVMKVLTIMASIFIPLTFIAGIYGMNFNPQASRWNMPELNWIWGYPAVLVVMAVVAAIMIIFFKIKKWF